MEEEEKERGAGCKELRTTGKFSLIFFIPPKSIYIFLLAAMVLMAGTDGFSSSPSSSPFPLPGIAFGGRRKK